MSLKIAILFSGVYDLTIKDKEVSSNERIPKKYLNHCEKHFKKYILNNNVDVFIHSYNSEHNNILIDFYKPKQYIFEEKIKIKVKDTYIHPCYKESPTYCLLSKTYSEKKVIELKMEYEKKHNFKYDFCLLTRFDVVWFNNINYDLLNTPNIDNVIFHSYCNKFNSKKFNGVLEHFILATSSGIDKYKDYHDYLNSINIQNNSSENSIFHIYQSKFIKHKKLNIKFFCYRFYDHLLLRNIFRIMKHNNYNRECINMLIQD